MVVLNDQRLGLIIGREGMEGRKHVEGFSSNEACIYAAILYLVLYLVRSQ